MIPNVARPAGLLIVALAALLLTTTAEAQAQEAATETEQVIAVIDAFHAALAAGDSTAALGQLAEDVIILESGGIEDKDHYRSGHLRGDMRFAQAVPRQRGEITVEIVGNVAWAYATSTAVGTMGDRAIDSQGAELMVLVRVADGWKIKAIHWSSRRRQ
ncbi:MAG: nuclear transport factor 2 family protein [Gemmatimonadota bacterium]|nr:nuclear transport factor 2 family protein [Gemmatimonadota bacterium]